MTQFSQPAVETQISVRGVQVKVPSFKCEGREIVVSKGWLKVATVRDEDYVLGEPVANPAAMIASVKKAAVPADIFSFVQRPGESQARHPYPFHEDNLAIISISTYDAWWASLSQETRRNVRTAAKRGLEVRAVPFDDTFVEGIRGIYNETPVRQGRRFWHYGKDFATVKRDNSSYVDRADFIGAYVGSELVGFIKMVYVDSTASIMQILCKNAHQDKKCMNALVAKAVEICHQKQIPTLIYCKYVYHKTLENPLTEFKRRNGFQKVHVPRYFVPLTMKGKLALVLRLHLPITESLPEPLVAKLLDLREWYYNRKVAAAPRGPASIARTPAGSEASG